MSNETSHTYRRYLKGANLIRANLEGAGLEEADLKGADLEGANLIGAYLRMAQNLKPEQLASANTDESTILPY